MTEGSVSRDCACTLKSHSGGAGATEHRPALLRAQTPPGTLVGGGLPPKCALGAKQAVQLGLSRDAELSLVLGWWSHLPVSVGVKSSCDLSFACLQPLNRTAFKVKPRRTHML